MWLLVAIISRFVSGSSAVIDKMLLKKSYQNPVGYTFWLGVLGLAALALVPSGFQILAPSQIFIALAAGAALVAAMFLLFSALFRSEASNSLVLIGAVSPVFTLLFSAPVESGLLLPYHIIAFVMFISTGFILYLAEEKHLRLTILALTSASGLFFGLSDALTKVVFLGANFVTGFIWIKVGGALLVLLFLIPPKTRNKIVHPPEHETPKHRIIYLLNRGYAGLGSVLIAYAILLGPPTLVNATVNLQYIFIMLGGWLILKEKFHGRVLWAKVSALILVSLGLLWLAFGNYLQTSAPRETRPIAWGVSFSEKFSVMMGLDWKKNYEAVVNDLKPRRLRLMVYWDMVEQEDNRFDFDDTDYQMKLAEQGGAKVILAIGQKVPRWPECHYPLWAKVLSADERNKQLLDYIQAVVLRYKESPALLYWQVENEPFLAFGECPPFDEKFFDKELELVRALDQKHHILVTDSGEISLWYQAVQKGDVFGTTIYRRVYNRIFGAIEYYLQPEFFRLKEKFSRFMSGDYDKRYIVAELGAEPWLGRQLYETSLDEQLKVFDLPYFEDTIEYAKQAGFDEYYLWGAEWWYWMKEKHGVPTFWDHAKSVIQSTP